MGLIGEMTVDDFLSGFECLGVVLQLRHPRPAWIVARRCLTGERWKRDGEFLGNVVQNAARLDDVALFVQGAFQRKAELIETLEAPLQVLQSRLRNAEDLRVSLVEAGLPVVCWLCDGGQDVFAQVVAIPTLKEDKRFK